MEKEHNIEEQKAQEALDFIEHIEEMSREEICNALKDKELVDMLTSLQDLGCVVNRCSHKEMVDAERSWRAFEKKYGTKEESNQKKSFWKGVVTTLISTAAVLIVFLSIRQFNDITGRGKVIELYSAVEMPETVKIITDDGSCYAADDNDFSAVRSIVATTGSLDYSEAVPSATTDTHTLVTPKNSDFHLVLDDGSEVWINSESKFTYPVSFNGNTREVYLEGEAYFKVAKETKRRFVVHCGNLVTDVLGTEFNVKGYNPEDMHVTLVGGVVSVYHTADSAYRITLKPGNDACFNSEGFAGMKYVDTTPFQMWRDGYLYFDDIPLKDVLLQIGEWYNYSVEVKDESILNYRLRFVANRKDPVGNMISLLNTLDKVKVTVSESDRKIIINERSERILSRKSMRE